MTQFKDRFVTIVKEFSFDSAHFLPNHPGKCRNLHGHTYKLQIGIRGAVNPENGMVVDFGDIKHIVKNRILDMLDHQYLNSVLDFLPTAENMAIWIFDILQGIYGNMAFVRVWETPTSFAEYHG